MLIRFYCKNKYFYTVGSELLRNSYVTVIGCLTSRPDIKKIITPSLQTFLMSFESLTYLRFKDLFLSVIVDMEKYA